MSVLIDAMNCLDECQAELSKYTGAVANSRYRLVIHDQELIVVYHKRSGRREITEYEPELYRILCSPSICSYTYDKQKNRLRVEIMVKQKSGERWGGYLGHFIYLYRHRECDLEEFLCTLPKGEDISIDHANDDSGNHCGWNLNKMTSRENQTKSTYMTRIKDPYYCFIAVDDENRYRIHFGYQNVWHHGQSFYILCETPETLAHFLKSATSLKSAPAFLRRHESVHSLWKNDKNAPYAAKNYYQSEKEAEMLLRMELADFDLWTMESTLKCCRSGRQYPSES